MATIAEERAANARARAEGYESAAHKEAHANVGASAAGYANAVQQEIDANRRAQAAGFANAAEAEMDANRRSIAAGFTSAVDQEIDANRRAREAGFLNAADLETYGTAGATRSTDPFVDPRTLPPPVIPEQFALGTANLLKYNPDQPNLPGYDPNWRDNYPGGFDYWGNPITGGGMLDGPPNPTVPSFGYPGYQDWTRFMPTNFGLAEGGGVHYQPWLQGGSQAMNAIQGAGGNFVARPDPVFGAGGGTATGGPGPINPNIWGNTDTTTGGNVTTDTSGNRWVMSPGGQWVPASSQYGQGLLGDARLFPAQQYDSSGNYVGFEGSDIAQNVQHGSGEGFGVLEKYFAQPSYVGDDPSYVDIGPAPTTSLLAGPYVGPISTQVAPSQNYGGISPYNAYSELGLLGIQASPGHAMDVTSQVDSFANMENAAWETAARETEAMMEAEANLEAMSSGGGHASKEMM